MDEILILARVRIHEFDLPIVEDYYDEVQKKLAVVPGFLGLSVWRETLDIEHFLIIYEYESLVAAQKGFTAISQIRVLAEKQAADFRPADVLRLKVHQYDPTRLAKTPAVSFLSLSERVADPGYGKELRDEIERIFGELSLLPGYIGSVYGQNDTLDEEVVGLAIWSSPEAFAGSLPPGIIPYAIKLFKRFR